MADKLFLQQERILATTNNSFAKVTFRDGIAAVVKQSIRKNSPKAESNWHREVRMLKLVRDKADRFPRLLDSDPETLTITLTYVSGDSLDKFIDESKLSVLSSTNCYCIWIQLASGLEFLHSRSIMHDDVKPENIIWNPQSQSATLIDFGAAHEIEPDSFGESGTPCYIAPEYLQRKRSEKYDVWALGVTMIFAFRYIALPEKEWLLPGVFSNHTDLGEMKRWLGLISDIREKLSTSMPLLAQMVNKDPQARIVAAELYNRLNLFSESDKHR